MRTECNQKNETKKRNKQKIQEFCILEMLTTRKCKAKALLQPKGVLNILLCIVKVNVSLCVVEYTLV